jgi:hypothetical protein
MNLKISVEIAEASQEQINSLYDLMGNLLQAGTLKETIEPRLDDPIKKETKTNSKAEKKTKEKKKDKIDLSDVMKVNLEIIDTFSEEESDEILKNCCDLAKVKKINEIKDDEAKCEFCYYHFKLILKEQEIIDTYEEDDAENILEDVCKKLKTKDLADLSKTNSCLKAIELLDKELNE